MRAALTHLINLVCQVYQKLLVSHILSCRVSDSGLRAAAMVSLFQQRGWTKHTLDFFISMMPQEIERIGKWNEPIADLCQTEIPQTLCFSLNSEPGHLRLHRCSSQLLELC